MQKLAFVFSAALCATLAPKLAHADDPTTAEGWYQEGSNQYDQGNFDKAIDAFKKGAELEPDPTKKSAYLYNVGQAYGQRRGPGDCSKAIFFYKRYLDLRDQPGAKPLTPEKRKAAEDKIAELQACAKSDGGSPGPTNPTNPKQNPTGPTTGPTNPKQNPTVVTPPAGGNTTKPKDPNVATKPGPGDGKGDGDGDGDGDGGEEGGLHRRMTGEGPTLLSARLEGGVSKVQTGNIPTPVHAGFALIGGYPLKLPVDKLSLEVGAAITYTPLLYQTSGMSKTGSLTGVMANAGASYEIVPKLSGRFDLGVGALVMAGVSNSVYTMDQPTTGALAMFTVRAGLSVDYAITNNILATVAPIAVEFSPAKAGLSDQIDHITRFDFMVGVGYRM